MSLNDVALKQQAILGSFQYELSLAAVVLICDKIEEMDLEVVVLIHQYASLMIDKPVIMTRHVILSLQVKALRKIWHAEGQKERKALRKKKHAPIVERIKEEEELGVGVS